MGVIQRPLSPHLTIYSPQLTSILSIVHRGTGAMLVILWIGYFMIMDREFVYGSFYGTLAGSSFRSSTAPFRELLALAGRSYHFFNGMRHFLWDQGLLLDLKAVYSSGWTVVACSTILTRTYTVLQDGMQPIFYSSGWTVVACSTILTRTYIVLQDGMQPFFYS